MAKATQQKLTKTGYRISKNGAVINGIESDAVKKYNFCGTCIKENGIYYFLNRLQGYTFVYLPE
jgi:hypothetical protein